MTRAWGNLTDRALYTLRTVGPLTQRELAARCGVTSHHLSSFIQRLSNAKGGRRSAPKRIYVQRWVYGLNCYKNHLRPVWALGDLPDAPKPPTKEDIALRLAQQRRAVVASECALETES